MLGGCVGRVAGGFNGLGGVCLGWWVGAVGGGLVVRLVCGFGLWVGLCRLVCGWFVDCGRLWVRIVGLDCGLDCGLFVGLGLAELGYEGLDVGEFLRGKVGVSLEQGFCVVPVGVDGVPFGPTSHSVRAVPALGAEDAEFPVFEGLGVWPPEVILAFLGEAGGGVEFEELRGECVGFDV